MNADSDQAILTSMTDTPHKKTFILGVGAQKSGTTWLSNYICNYPQTHAGLTKEYHVWDAVFILECREFAVEPDDAADSPLLALRQRLQGNLDLYPDYFCGLLSQPGITIAADITPAYAGLNRTHFARIYDDFQRRGVDCRVVFLMRDPVERCWSAVRMIKKVQSDLYSTRSDEDILLTYFGTTDARFRTEYQHTIRELEAAIPAGNIYYGIYEEMMQPAKIEALSRFVGVVPDFAFSGRTFGALPKNEIISPSARRVIAAEYRDVYEFCADRFPQTLALWNAPD